MARPPKQVSVRRNIRIDQVAGLFESQLEQLIAKLTDELYVKLRTESPPGPGTPVVTGTLISSWRKESVDRFTGRVYVSSKLNPNGSNTQDYAPAVMFGESMPPSWKGKYAPGKGSPPKTTGTPPVVKRYPEKILDQIIETRLSRILRRITGGV
tara:strand:+ start:915 stop:1376 length:462 start_codon:yes stop_codon:yes gene_type:complete